MEIVTGIDLIEIDRVQKAIERHGQRFLGRIFTLAELDECDGRVESLAVRFAAKEAVAKALGCGIGKVGWQEIEILRGEANKPNLILHGQAYQAAIHAGLQSWSISLSHTHSQAVAVVVGFAP